MTTHNLDVGVERAMVATLKERGDSAPAAATKAKAKLAQACAYARAQADAAADDERSKRDHSYPWRKAFQDLKHWTLKNVP
jgi:hypothetical protein